MDYKTPGVYIEEISLLPPSVAQVATAIPAFIGYTEEAKSPTGKSLLNIPTRIKSMVDYQRFFGNAAAQSFSVTLADTPPFLPIKTELGDASPYRMVYALQMYFANGGGPCYIVSVGDYKADATAPSLDEVDDYKELKKGLDAVRKVDEVTLLVIPEADRLALAKYHDIYKDMLIQCGEKQDRFAIFDVRTDEADAAKSFRDGIGTSFLNYGAAYYPYLKTSLSYHYLPSSVTFKQTGGTKPFDGLKMETAGNYAHAVAAKGEIASIKAELDNLVAEGKPGTNSKDQKTAILKRIYVKSEVLLPRIKELIYNDGGDTEITKYDTTSDEISDIVGANHNTIDKLNTAMDDMKSKTDALITEVDKVVTSIQGSIAASKAPVIAKYYTNAFEIEVKKQLQDFSIDMPPSSTMAGIYAAVDRTRGVWKAPANVSVNRVTAPSVKIGNDDQRSLNVHTTGKSINAIRAFSGKGILVWGARTLAGNDNEWRYISVRRFYNMVEESTKKATEQFVFEPNDANTWTKVRSMIENFLTIQWRSGALMGASPEAAYFVRVGLGETMTELDVLEGRMIIDIGMAVVRPAEFIILRFSHKMQNN